MIFKFKPLLLLSLILVSNLGAHELNPARLILEEQENRTFDVIWKFPSNVLTKPGSILFPSGCTETLTSLPKKQGKYQITESTLVCDSDLRNQTLTVKGLSRMTDALISIRFTDGGQFEGLVSVTDPKVLIPGESNLYPTNYFWLGVEHLLSGIDHLIFVLGLIFIVIGFKTLVKTITAFTVAHSITLGLSVTGIFQLPQSTAEALIALTLIYLAIEVGEKERYYRTPWLLAFGFGLLHGFGFAGALSEVGFSESTLLYSLLFFNLGIEAGQLLVIPVFILIVWMLNKINISKLTHQFSSYMIGGIACFWLIERVNKILVF